MIDYLKTLLNLPDHQRYSLVPALKEVSIPELAKLKATIQMTQMNLITVT